MEVSPYLQAIQQVAGSTPGEKFNTLNGMAQTIADDLQRQGATSAIKIHLSSELPAALVPLVRVEVARRLRIPEVIVEALISGESMVIHRALKAIWFFDGSVKSFTNAEYFKINIFPYLSLNHRRKVIKALGRHLKDTDIADDFYELVADKLYYQCQAEPLLRACSDEIIWGAVYLNHAKLSYQSMKCIFKKYPETIIQCLKRGGDHLYVIFSIWDGGKIYKEYIYKNFLPQLIKHKRIKDFIEVVKSSHKATLTYVTQLNLKDTKLFLKNEHGFEALTSDPTVFLPTLSLKVVTEKLTKNQFQTLLLQLHHDNYQDCQGSEQEILYPYLKFYPEEERKRLFFSILEQSYGPNIPSRNFVYPNNLRCLPKEQRIEFAKSTAQFEETECVSDKIFMQKICFRSTEESIPAIKQDITLASTVEDKEFLFQQLIFTCSVNADTETLLKVLEYINISLQEDDGWVVLKALTRIITDFSLDDITLDHWKILETIWLQIPEKQELMNKRVEHTCGLVLLGITYHLIYDRPIIGEFHSILVNYAQGVLEYHWQKFQATGHIEKKILTLLFKYIPLKENYEKSTLECLLKVVGDFNSRYRKGRGQQLSLKSYPWLLEYIERCISNEHDLHYQIYHLMRITDEIFYTKLNLRLGRFEILLKSNPQEIINDLHHWYIKFRNIITEPYVQQLIKSLRWHQEIPMKLAEMSKDEFSTTRSGESLYFLALLLHGSELEVIIKSISPDTPIRNCGPVIHPLVFSIMGVFSLTDPMMSVDLMCNYIKDDVRLITLAYLKILERRGPAHKIVQLAMKLVNRMIFWELSVECICRVGSKDDVEELRTKHWDRIRCSYRVCDILNITGLQ